MAEWLQDYAQVISAFATSGMVLVWLLYLQLFFYNYRQQRQAYVLLQQSAGDIEDSECLLVNLSPTPVDVVAVLVRIEEEGEYHEYELEALLVTEEDEERMKAPYRRRGPLHSGQSTVLGTFAKLLEAHARTCKGEPQRMRTRSLEVRVVYFYPISESPLGAKRRFYFERDPARGWLRVYPETARTHQYNSWRYRRTVERWYQQAFGQRKDL